MGVLLANGWNAFAAAPRGRWAARPFATDVPSGHGHVHTAEYVDAWAHVLQPPGWTEEKADRLQDLLASD